MPSWPLSRLVVRLRSRLGAGATLPASIRVQVGVLQRVSVGAVRLGALVLTLAAYLASERVLSVRDSFDVVRVHATSMDALTAITGWVMCVTGVLAFQSLRDRTVRPDGGCSVRSNDLLSETKVPVPLDVARGGPQPARSPQGWVDRAVLVDLLPESILTRRLRSSHGINVILGGA